MLGGSPLAPPAGLVPVAPLAPHSEVTQWHRHIVDDAARDEARVSWAYLPGVAQAAALALGGGEVPNPGYRHHELIEIAAERLYDRGVPIPWDYANADARPTSLPDREYAEVRASGDGRSVAGIKPRLVRERELAAAPPSAPGFTAHAESSCHGPHLQYRRPPPHPSQPAPDAGSSSRISRVASRIGSARTAAPLPAPPPQAPSPPPPFEPPPSPPPSPSGLAFSPLRPASAPALPRACSQPSAAGSGGGLVTLTAALPAEAVVLVPVNLHCRPPVALRPDLFGSCLASAAPMPGAAPGARRAEATRTARVMLAKLLPSHGPSPVAQCHMVGAAKVGGSPSVYVVAAPVSRLRNAFTSPRAPAGFQWRPLSGRLSVGIFTLVKIALVGVACLADPSVRMVAGVRTGAIPDAPTTRGTANASPFIDAGARAALVDRELRTAADLFEASAGADSERAMMWRSGLEVFDREPSQPPRGGFSHISIPRLAAPGDSSLPRVGHQRVRSSLPAATSGASAGVGRHTRRAQADVSALGAVRHGSPSGGHYSAPPRSGQAPRTRAWDEDARKPQLRGTILDYRGGWGTGKLLDVSSPAIPTHLNLEAWRQHFAGSRNRRLF